MWWRHEWLQKLALDTCLLNYGLLQRNQASRCRRATSLTAAHSFRGLFCTAQAIFSPDERLVVTGTSANRSGKGGAVVFYDAKTHELVRRVAMPSSAVGLAWHERLNQIFVGVGAPSTKSWSRSVTGAMRFFHSRAVWPTECQWRHSCGHLMRMLVCRLAVPCPGLAVASLSDGARDFAHAPAQLHALR